MHALVAARPRSRAARPRACGTSRRRPRCGRRSAPRRSASMLRVLTLPMSCSSAPQRTSRRGTACHTTCLVCFQTSLWRHSPSPKPTMRVHLGQPRLEHADLEQRVEALLRVPAEQQAVELVAQDARARARAARRRPGARAAAGSASRVDRGARAPPSAARASARGATLCAVSSIEPSPAWCIRARGQGRRAGERIYTASPPAWECQSRRAADFSRFSGYDRPRRARRMATRRCRSADAHLALAAVDRGRRRPGAVRADLR